ncbi:MAG: hypothetical protein AAB403_00170, partial [Planctomycetota bacterium]
SIWDTSLFYVSQKLLERTRKISLGLLPMENEQQPRSAGFTLAAPADLKPAEGLWVAFTKTFKLEITPELWKIFQDAKGVQ